MIYSLMCLRTTSYFQFLQFGYLVHRHFDLITIRLWSDDIETQIKSLEDKLLSKIAALKQHLFNDIFDLRNDITLLKENNEKEKLSDSSNEKDEVLLLKEKIKFLESENGFLKSDINITQKVIDSILEHNSN